MMPSIKRKEWRDLVMSPVNPKLLSHSFKIKLQSIRRKIRSGVITQEQGIKELHNECQKHFDIYKSDLYQIFQR